MGNEHKDHVAPGTIYDAAGAKVTKHGGNDPIHDGIRTEKTPEAAVKENRSSKG